MCLGVPMQVAAREGYIARCEAGGISRTVNLFLLQHDDICLGDHVMVHVGYAIQKIDAADAETVWKLLDEALAGDDEGEVNA
jgi:hydrogenase expression/formation protein HypC